jgi:hypothetical protein
VKYALPSILSAATDEHWGNKHDYFFAEQDANVRAFKYFSENIDGFNLPDEDNNEHYSNGRWWENKNPIRGYDWYKSYDDPANQSTLSGNKFSTTYFDFLTLGTDGLLVMFGQFIFGYGRHHKTTTR